MIGSYERSSDDVKKGGDNMSRNLRNEIREDLMNQLNQKGLSGKYYIDLVEDYMRLWDMKEMLAEDN